MGQPMKGLRFWLSIRSEPGLGGESESILSGHTSRCLIWNVSIVFEMCPGTPGRAEARCLARGPEALPFAGIAELSARRIGETGAVAAPAQTRESSSLRGSSCPNWPCRDLSPMRRTVNSRLAEVAEESSAISSNYAQPGPRNRTVPDNFHQTCRDYFI